MKIYNMHLKKFEIVPTQDLGINHLLVFSSYSEIQQFDFARFKDPYWTYCSIQKIETRNGAIALAGGRGALPGMYFRCEGLSSIEIVEKFLDQLMKEGKDTI